MKTAIDLLVQGKEIPRGLMREVMLTIMRGEADSAAIGGFLTALTLKGETVSEVTAAAEVMRELAQEVSLAETGVVVDTVGTGGDGASLLNVSTASAIIATAAGVKIAKHGNIAASSSSGSADFLREAGVALELAPEQVNECMAQTGFGFMFAPAFHGAMRHVVPARRAIGIRTLFNVLGPLANPAKVKYQVLGVFSKAWLRPMVEVSRQLGSKHVLAVHSRNGLDEFSVTDINDVVELKPDGSILEYSIFPRDFDMDYDSHAALQVANSADSLRLVRSIFDEGSPAIGFDMLALNTAAVFYVAGVVDNWADGVQLAKDTMTSGKASTQLARIAEVTQAFEGK